MAFLAAAAPFAALAGGVLKGVGGLIAGHRQKKQDYQQAQQEEMAALEQANMAKADARRQIGEQLAAQYSNGFEGGSGSALDYLRESQVNAVLDAMNVRRQGFSRATALRAHGNQAMSSAEWGAASDLLGGVSQYAGMKSDWAQARQGTVPSGGGG